MSSERPPRKPGMTLTDVINDFKKSMAAMLIYTGASDERASPSDQQSVATVQPEQSIQSAQLPQMPQSIQQESDQPEQSIQSPQLPQMPQSVQQESDQPEQSIQSPQLPQMPQSVQQESDQPEQSIQSSQLPQMPQSVQQESDRQSQWSLVVDRFIRTPPMRQSNQTTHSGPLDNSLQQRAESMERSNQAMANTTEQRIKILPPPHPHVDPMLRSHDLASHLDSDEFRPEALRMRRALQKLAASEPSVRFQDYKFPDGKLEALKLMRGLRDKPALARQKVAEIRRSFQIPPPEPSFSEYVLGKLKGQLSPELYAKVVEMAMQPPGPPQGPEYGQGPPRRRLGPVPVLATGGGIWPRGGPAGSAAVASAAPVAPAAVASAVPVASAAVASAAPAATSAPVASATLGQASVPRRKCSRYMNPKGVHPEPRPGRKVCDQCLAKDRGYKRKKVPE
ncbi:hypothetical protein FN846DRAFT_994131 [Sphaerosporella brunnea]|uniref:Uncharacterized protein n=1 Tax=Sphaerosporella brunnea TaxID=1250544 RepID=A0A5J5ENE7_9PEZI|nr:hypothetical protein FN846DRAFT_994131 [Sphaerosporella brunnea]